MSAASGTTSAGTDNPNNGAKLYDAAGGVINNASKQTQAAGDELMSFAREEPVATALCALILGYILGKIF